MMENAKRLSDGGLFVSAESMINYRTHLKDGGYSPPYRRDGLSAA